MKTLTYTAKCSHLTHRQSRVFLDPQRALWNAGLEQRITVYQPRGVSVQTYGPYKDLTELRQRVAAQNAD